MTNILRTFNMAKEIVAIKAHPIQNLDLETKTHYLNGLALLAYVDDELHEREVDAISALIRAAGLGEDKLETVKTFAQNPQQESITEMINTIKASDEKTSQAFMIDALLLIMKDGTLHENEAALIQNYFEAFSFTQDQEQKLRDIVAIIQTKNENKAMFLALEDKSLYDAFHYWFDFLGFDSHQKITELFANDFVEWKCDHFVGFRVDPFAGVAQNNYMTVAASPVTNQQFAFFINYLYANQLLLVGENQKTFTHIEHNQLLFNVENSKITFDNGKFSCLPALNATPVTGVTAHGASQYAHWLNKYVLAKKSLFDYSIIALKGTELSWMAGIELSESCPNKSEYAELFYEIDSQKYHYYLPESNEEEIDSTVIVADSSDANRTFRLARIPRDNTQKSYMIN